MDKGTAVTKPRAVIFDLDGTIAKRDMGPDGRSPYDMTRVAEDMPNMPVIVMAQLVHHNRTPEEDVQLIFASGRDESARQATEVWLRQYFEPGYQLYMREENDMRPDEMIKFLLLQHLQQTWDIIAAFDDRNRVVDMWRANGITCFQVCSREEGGF